ncbi:MAG: hypothetical protein ACRDF4_04155 [Rhabdochlamydiaceae bacterium]
MPISTESAIRLMDLRNKITSKVEVSPLEMRQVLDQIRGELRAIVPKEKKTGKKSKGKKTTKTIDLSSFDTEG